MADISLADIKKLRDMTSAGMMDCKKALTEAEGDFKRVAATPDFKALAASIADAAIAEFPADLAALKAVKTATGYTLDEDITNQAGKTGEKHILAYYAGIEAPFVSEYVHFNGKLGAIVAFNKEVPAEIARGIAMQVASMNPVAVDEASVPAEVLESEKTVAIQKTKDEQIQKAIDAVGINPAHVDSEDHIESNTAKGWLTPEQAAQAREIIAKVGAEKAANLPAQMIENIAKGRIAKFLKENTLEEQEYQLSDNKETVKAALAAVDPTAKVLCFKRFSLAD